MGWGVKKEEENRTKEKLPWYMYFFDA